MSHPEKSPGDIVSAIVHTHRPFGVFVDMDGERNALIAIVHMHDDKTFRITQETMPPIGSTVRAIVFGREKDGQYALSLRKSDFAHRGKEDQWQDWTNNSPHP